MMNRHELIPQCPLGNRGVLTRATSGVIDLPRREAWIQPVILRKPTDSDQTIVLRWMVRGLTPNRHEVGLPGSREFMRFNESAQIRKIRVIRVPFFLAAAALSQDFHNWLAVVDVEPLPARDVERAGIQPQLVQHRRMNIGDVMLILDSIKTEFIGDAMLHAPLDAPPGQPGTEPVGMMIPARPLGTR